jgi:lysophospholipase L1-like esterase
MLAIGTVMLLASCGSNGSDSGSDDEAAAAETDGIGYVALGGSIASGAGSAYGEGYPDFLTDMIEADSGRSVDLVDLSIGEGGTAQAVLDLLAQPSTEEALKAADIVTLEIGGNDLIAGDEPYLAGECKGLACYDDAQALFETNYEEVVGRIAELAGDDAALRAVTFYDPAQGDPTIEEVMGAGFRDLTRSVVQRLNAATCRIAEAAGWLCVDVYPSFNGPQGIGSPYDKDLVIEGNDYMHPTEKGHRLIASLILDSGYED